MLSVKLFFGSIRGGGSGRAPRQAQKIKLGGRIYIIFPKQINITRQNRLRCLIFAAFCLLGFRVRSHKNSATLPLIS